MEFSVKYFSWGVKFNESIAKFLYTCVESTYVIYVP